ncbi:MAG: hypothetical protein P1U81_18755 [Verrucomicrobiales bacterium]|jgi:hypothetical protein|nr:hypothetical protein [Verrucomicrobiales bacterium]
MDRWKNLSLVFDTMPVPAQIFVGLFLLAFAGASLYARLNVKFGAAVFPGFPPERLRTDKLHIIAYTGIPVFLALFFFGLLATYHLK